MTIAGIPIIIFAITLGFTIAIGAIIYSLIPVQSEVAKRLKRAEAMSFQGSSRRSDAFAKIFNEKQRGKLAAMLQEAGMYTISPAQMGVRMIACGGVGLLFGLAFTAAMGEFSPLYLMGTVMLALAGAYLPFSRLGRAAKKRKADIQRALPDFLDMLASTVQAGLGFNAALNHAVDVAAGPLGDEIKAALSEVRMGRSKADALRAMADRVKQEQLSAVVTAVVQAERLGSNMAQILDELAEEVRNRRMMRAEELANMMPTKMVIPMALFMLPALFVMIFGGIVAQYLAGPK
jgi:Flp pilus assembly protein TadB